MDHEVAGSNPVTQTKKRYDKGKMRDKRSVHQPPRKDLLKSLIWLG